MEKVIITGGSGFIGSYICRELLDRGYQPVIFDGFISHVTPNKKKIEVFFHERFKDIVNDVIVERGFTNHYEVCYSVLERHKPSYIIHLAALPLAKLPNLNMQEAMEGALQSTSNLFSVCDKLKLNLKRFVYASSSMVYGNFVTKSVTEESPTNPIEIYGTVKLAGEVITKGLSKYYSIPYTIIRPSAVYGPGDANKRVSQIFVENAHYNKPIKVNGKDEKLDFSYVKDVAKGFVDSMLSKNATDQTYNLTSGKARTLLEYAQIVQKHYPDVKIEITERDSFRPVRGTLDISKAQNDFNFSPKYNIEEGIKEYVDFFKKYK